MILIYLFLLHFIADFLMQSREMGAKKSQYFKWLLKHCVIQFVIFNIGISIYLTPSLGLSEACKIGIFFGLSNALIHGIIDWNIWKLYKLRAIRTIRKNKIKVRDFKYWEDHWFYTTIGADQFLHSITIALLAKAFLL